MVNRVAVLVVVCALWACGKKQDDPFAAPGSAAPAPATTATPASDPWAAPPASADKTLGADVGGRLSQIGAAKRGGADKGGAADGTEGGMEREVAVTGGGRLSRLAAKINASSVEKPAEPSLAIKGFGKIEQTGFSLTYNPSKSPVHEQFRAALQDNKVFEQVVEGLNKTVRMPRTVDIQLVDCGTINAFYDPKHSRIIVCYELLDYFLSVFKGSTKTDTELGNAVIGATMFSFFHEAGHGLIHQLELPAVGREEDSVDQLATLILIAGGEQGVSMALSGAYWFQLQSKRSVEQTPFWDEHAFDAQRFYNIMCLIYGSDPTKYAEFVTSGSLPADRAKRCPDEYGKINKAWEKLLQPHLTNGAAINIAYKPSVPQAEAPTQTGATDPWADKPATPTPMPTAPATPVTAAITCEQVATRAAELIGAEAEARAKAMSADEVEKMKTRLEAELPAVIEKVLAECAKADWSDASRKCVLDAKTLAQASKCN